MEFNGETDGSLTSLTSLTTAPSLQVELRSLSTFSCFESTRTLAHAHAHTVCRFQHSSNTGMATSALSTDPHGSHRPRPRQKQRSRGTKVCQAPLGAKPRNLSPKMYFSVVTGTHHATSQAPPAKWPAASGYLFMVPTTHCLLGYGIGMVFITRRALWLFCAGLFGLIRVLLSSFPPPFLHEAL